MGSAHLVLFVVFGVAAGCEDLYKMQGDECGQLCLSGAKASLAKQFGGVSSGTCASQGYTVEAGTEKKTEPVIGTFTITLYKKPAGAEAAGQRLRGAVATA